MRRFLSCIPILLLQLSLMSCSHVSRTPDGYNLEVATYFRSNDAGWASKWKELDGGLSNIQRSLSEEHGYYFLIHVTGVDPKQREVSTLCVVFVTGPPRAGTCVLEKAHQVFVPVEIVVAETAGDLWQDETTIRAIVRVRPTSWLNIKPRTIGAVELEVST